MTVRTGGASVVRDVLDMAREVAWSGASVIAFAC